MVFFISPTIKMIIIPFPFDVQFNTFSFKYFSYSEFFLIRFLQFFFIKTSSNFSTIQIINYVCPTNWIFNFTNNKIFNWSISSASFSKNVFIFWNSNIVTSCKTRVFFIKIFILFSIRIVCNVSRFHFNSFMNCVTLFINNII